MELSISAWKRKKRVTDRWMALVVFLGVLAVYAVTLCRGPFPGPSAELLAAHVGVEPLLRPMNPLWSFLVRLVVGLGRGGIALRVHWLQAILGALAAAGIYQCVSWLVFRTISWEEATAARARSAAVLAGLSTALAMGFSTPFWMVATRAYPHVLEVGLLIVTARLLQSFEETGRKPFAWGFALLYGIGLAESAAFWVLAPVFLVFLLWILYEQGRLRFDVLLPMLIAGVVGCGMFFVAATRFYGSEGFLLAGFGGYLQIIRVMIQNHIHSVRGGLPRVGWLVIVLMCVAPWLTSLVIARRGLNDERDWSYYVLHLVMTAVAVLILYNMRVAPWPLLGLSAMPVMPYVLVAMVVGYLTAYWYLLAAFWWPDASPGNWRSLVRRRVGPALGIPLLLATVAAGVLNFPAADGRQVDFIHRYVDAMIDSVEGRHWLVTDGSFDHMLLLRAHERRLPEFRTLNLARHRDGTYLKRIKGWFPEPWMQNAAELGVLSFVQQYIRRQVQSEQTVALAVMPDLWAGVAQVHLEPRKTLFLGTRYPERIDPERLLAQHKAFWNQMAPLVTPREEALLLTGSYRRYIRRQMGMVANNLGVFFADRNLEEMAFDAYRQARSIDPENVSAMLNLLAMAQQPDTFLDAEVVATIETEGEEFAKGISDRMHVWSLSRHYGYVRNPAAFARLGWTWALSGQPGMAVSGLRRALDMSPSGDQEAIKEALASSYMLADEEEESEMLFREILHENPRNVRALLSLARIAMRRRDLVEARGFLERAAEANAPPILLAMEWASIYFSEGEIDRARLALEELIQVEPQEVRAWAMLSAVLVHKGDLARLRQMILDMELRFGPEEYVVLISKAQLAFQEGRWHSSRDFFSRASERRRREQSVLEWLLRLDTILRDADRARNHARMLLQINPDNSFGNYILGTLSLNEGRFEHAEAFLRRSLEARRAPETLNDLAELLLRTDRIEEAESLTREALHLNDSLHVIWDTLAGILVRQGRFEEAERAYEEAIRLYPNDLRSHLNLALLLRRTGDMNGAREIVRMLEMRRLELPPREQEDLRKLSADLVAQGQ